MYRRFFSRCFFFVAVLLVTGTAVVGSTSGRPLNGITIMLDPGHGGADPGAVGPTGLRESETNLRVAKYLRQLLEADGATVLMTRETDVFLSLAERVEAARQNNPDLFISIHHNASMSPVYHNRAEVYYNALDRGLSAITSSMISDQFVNHELVPVSNVIPGGFYVLRNNTAPALLTEWAFITIPEIEQALRSGRNLTDQAQAIRTAIRKVFSTVPIRVHLVAATSPVKVNTPFFNLVFVTNSPVNHLRMQSEPSLGPELKFDRMPVFGNHYTLYNDKPLSSGKFDLKMWFYGQGNAVSRMIPLSLEVELPIENSWLLPVAPFIPVGYKGSFPVYLILKDYLGRQNSREVDFHAIYGEKLAAGATDSSGRGVIMLELDGTERDFVEVVAHTEEKEISKTLIPIRYPSRRFVLGRVANIADDSGVLGARITYGDNRTITTGLEGYFFFELPFNFGNLKINLKPGLGYNDYSHWLRFGNETVALPTIMVEPTAPRAMGKTIGIIAPRRQDDVVRPLVRDIMNLGAKVVRLNFPEDQANPVHHAIVHANSIAGLNLIVSIKESDVNNITLRHFWRGGTGGRFAKAIKRILEEAPSPVPLVVQPASDYEINHSGAACLVVVLPREIPADYPARLIQAITQAMREEL